MTLKEKFLAVKDYAEFDKRREEFRYIDMSDQEIRDHVGTLFRTSNSNAYQEGIFEDVFYKEPPERRKK